MRADNTPSVNKDRSQSIFARFVNEMLRSHAQKRENLLASILKIGDFDQKKERFSHDRVLELALHVYANDDLHYSIT